MKLRAAPVIETFDARDFEYLEVLGKGSFAKVYKVRHKTSNEFYAMKIVDKNSIFSKKLERYVMTERNILAMTRHPYIVTLRGAFQTSSQLALILQYCSKGNLHVMICKRLRLEENLCQLYTAEILLALSYLHERRIIFRDLKPDNVVIDEASHAMLTDFGLSKDGVGSRGARTYCGCAIYLAPEIVLGKSYGHAVDIYNLGSLLYCMLTGSPPYHHHDHRMRVANIREGNLFCPDAMSPNARSLCKALLQYEPSMRLGAGSTRDVQYHPFFDGLDFAAVLAREVPVPACGDGPPNGLRPLKPGAPLCPFPQTDARGSTRDVAAHDRALPGWEFVAGVDGLSTVEESPATSVLGTSPAFGSSPSSLSGSLPDRSPTRSRPKVRRSRHGRSRGERRPGGDGGAEEETALSPLVEARRAG